MLKPTRPKKYKRMSKPAGPSIKVVKRYLKFLQIAKNPQTIKSVLKNCPDRVVKGICNVALNASKGEVHLTPKQKKVLARHRQVISNLIDRNKSVKSKRAIINQKGNGIFLPLLISAVVGSLGSAIFNKP